MNGEGRNYILAIGLSILVLVGWQFFVAGPQLEKSQQQAQIAAEQAQSEATADLPTPGTASDGAAIATSSPAIVGTRGRRDCRRQPHSDLHGRARWLDQFARWSHR